MSDRDSVLRALGLKRLRIALALSESRRERARSLRLDAEKSTAAADRLEAEARELIEILGPLSQSEIESLKMSGPERALLTRYNSDPA